MSDPRRDEIAREAARLIHAGRAADIDDALHRAAHSLGYGHAKLPSHLRVRQHAQAMTLQSIGDAAYNECRLNLWRIAEQVMTIFEHTMPEADCEMAGRLAEGHIDAGVAIHIRIFTRCSDADIARSLRDFGYDEARFEMVVTRIGRLQQVRFSEEGHEVVLTRVPPALASHAVDDLVTGKPIERLSLTQLRRLIDGRAV